MEASQWVVFLRSRYHLGAEASTTPENHVRWTQTPENHLYTAELPGLRKEEIKVEIEDSLFVVIRTEWALDEEGSDERRRKKFVRKFRLPRLVEVEDISARYVDGVLTVTVPRSIVRGRFRINAGDVTLERDSVAPAA